MRRNWISPSTKTGKRDPGSVTMVIAPHLVAGMFEKQRSWLSTRFPPLEANLACSFCWDSVQNETHIENEYFQIQPFHLSSSSIIYLHNILQPNTMRYKWPHLRVFPDTNFGQDFLRTLWWQQNSTHLQEAAVWQVRKRSWDVLNHPTDLLGITRFCCSVEECLEPQWDLIRSFHIYFCKLQ